MAFSALLAMYAPQNQCRNSVMPYTKFQLVAIITILSEITAFGWKTSFFMDVYDYFFYDERTIEHFTVHSPLISNV